MANHRRTDLDFARDELFAHMHRCGVLSALPEQQEEWLNDTIEFMGERYPALAAAELAELHTMGLRFCQPVIPHGKDHTAETVPEHAELAAAV